MHPHIRIQTHTQAYSKQQNKKALLFIVSQTF